jgi:hypothetical protein
MSNVVRQRAEPSHRTLARRPKRIGIFALPVYECLCSQILRLWGRESPADLKGRGDSISRAGELEERRDVSLVRVSQGAEVSVPCFSGSN